MLHQVIVISDGEEEEDGEEKEGADGCRPRKRRHWRSGSDSSPATADLIDLTEEDSGVGGVQHSDTEVIDLTALEEFKDMLSSSDSSLDYGSESSHCEDDCLFVKESCVQNTPLPDSSGQVSPLPEVKVIYDDMSVDSSLDSYCSVSTSSGCDLVVSNQSPSSSQHSCIAKDLMSDSGTAVNSDLGSLDSPDSERPSRTNSSSSRSIHTSPDSLLEDPPDSTSKHSREASPAQTTEWAESTDWDPKTSSVENSAIACRGEACGRLGHCHSLEHVRDLCDDRSSLESSSCVNFGMSCDRLGVNHPVRSTRNSYDLANSLENTVCVPNRPFHPLNFTRTMCNEKPSVENMSHVTSREISDSKPSQSYSYISRKESGDHRPTVEHLHYVTDSQTFNKKSIRNCCIGLCGHYGDRRPSVENLPPVTCSMSDQPHERNSPHVSRKESGDGKALAEKLPHVTSILSSDKSSNVAPMFLKELDSRSSLEFYKVSGNKLVNNHFLENTFHISSNEHCNIVSCLEREPIASGSGLTNNWSTLEKVRHVCTGSSNRFCQTPHPLQPSRNDDTYFTVLRLPHPNPSQERETPKPLVSQIALVPDQFSSPRIQGNSDTSPKTTSGPSLASRAWLNKLKYFRKLPIHHFFYQSLKQDEEMCKNQHKPPVPISNRRMNMVNTTMEEGFAHGTLQFLMDFVSPQHYAKKETVSHVIHNILLGKEDLEILPDAYTVLIQIQQFHPADISSVAWNWKLLSEVMDAQDAKMPGRFLFLRYALQTLEDDFQKNLVRRTLQKSIAKTMLSCDQHFSNVRDVIRWLTDAVTRCSTETEPSSSPGSWPDAARNQNMMLVCILQQMLSMAVEVDKSPTISSNKMAETMFPYVLSIRQRCQRDTFFNTMTSQLLRGKLLEVMFDHSCETPPAQALSRSKVLYFLEHSTLLLEGQGADAEWQRWDELLHHIFLLFISYESILFDHLRCSLTERVDLTIRKAKPQLIKADIISKQDVDEHMGAFCRRVNQGQEDIPDAQLLERTQVLRTVLYTAVQR